MVERQSETQANLVYPQELVHRYGAKAGVLLYIAERLPDIPQSPMVVNESGEDIDQFIARADQAGIGWPRFFRSSAAAELLGYEGQFSTKVVRDDFETGHRLVSWNPNNYGLYRDREYFDKGIRNIIEGIQNSPQDFKREGLGQDLPDQISVIITEKAPSKYVGTYIKHPNQEGVFLITITEDDSRNLYGGAQDAVRTSFVFSQEKGLEELEGYSLDHIAGEEIKRDLSQVVTWHDGIAALADIDSSWSYQIEFGIDPPCLFQVRPFKSLKKPTFTLKEAKDENEYTTPIVIGTTNSKGIVLKVVDSDSEITDEEVVFVDEMRVAWKAADFPNLRAVLLSGTHGFLQHSDVATMRKAQVSGLYRVYPFYGVNPDDRIRVKADGKRLKVTKSTETLEAERRLFKAEDLIKKFMRKNRKAIQALRSACQHFEQRPQVSERDSPHIKRLREISSVVEKESGGQLLWPDSGSLCQISEDDYKMQHTGATFDVRSDAVRGFYFRFYIDGVDYHCFELDAGESRRYYDQKSHREKLAFMKNFGEEVRKINTAGDTPFPSGFTAFVTVTEEGYFVEDAVEVGR